MPVVNWEGTDVSPPSSPTSSPPWRQRRTAELPAEQKETATHRHMVRWLNFRSFKALGGFRQWQLFAAFMQADEDQRRLQEGLEEGLFARLGAQIHYIPVSYHPSVRRDSLR